ncbi:MAG: hypothetical protein JWO38_4703, partial [Gemmataceae bacterium]|nr:hypothetical protein [Gemmataceae bacterium]
VSERTVFRRLANPTFRDRLSATQAAALSPAYGMLTTGLTDACFKLNQLVRHPNPHVGFKAAKAVVDLTLKMREQVDVEDRVTALERIAAGKDKWGVDQDPEDEEPGDDPEPGGPGGAPPGGGPAARPPTEPGARGGDAGTGGGKTAPGLPNTDKSCHDPIPGAGSVGERPERACAAGTPTDRRKDRATGSRPGAPAPAAREEKTDPSRSPRHLLPGAPLPPVPRSEWE